MGNKGGVSFGIAPLFVIASILVIGLALALFGTIHTAIPYSFSGGTSYSVTDSTTITVITTCLCPVAGNCPCSSGKIITSSHILNYSGIALVLGALLGFGILARHSGWSSRQGNGRQKLP